jgi:rare lipoprotein A
MPVARISPSVISSGARHYSTSLGAKQAATRPVLWDGHLCPCCGAPKASPTPMLTFTKMRGELPVLQEHTLMTLHCRLVCEAIMGLLSRIAIALVSAWIGMHVNPAGAQPLWSIIPKAHAEPAPEVPAGPTKQQQTQTARAGKPALGTGHRSAPRSFKQRFTGKRSFTGKASYYSYRTGKTASGSLFNRDLRTAAHRSLPFGTRVRVTDLATRKSVIVTVTDRGPWVPGRLLDLSLAAARTLGITDRGVVHVRAEVL